MSGVTASKLARGDGEQAETIASQLKALLEDLAGTPLPDEGSGFERLRALCADAESLVERARELGAIIPNDRSWVSETIDFMEALTREGWRSPITKKTLN